MRQAPPLVAFPQWDSAGGDERSEEFTVRFPSAVTTPHEANNVVPVRAILPRKRSGPVPAVVVLHYWGATDYKVERSIADELNSRGIAAVLVALPYHLERTPPGSRSGSMAIQPDPEKLKATMRQCVLDVRRTFDWMASRPEFDSSKIGLLGTSLGAIVAALVSGLDGRVAAASYVLGGADLAHVLWRSSRVVAERDALRAKGFTEERLREALAPIEPLSYLIERGPRRSFVIGARYDTVVPPASTQKLIEALEEPAVLWLQTGHYGGFFVQKRMHHEAGRFFEASFSGGEYEPPKAILAPTIRLGVSLYAERGLQVAAGLDVWRGDAEGTYFANVQLAPRGLQAFVGGRLDRGLALGIFLRSGQIAPGLFWSIVL